VPGLSYPPIRKIVAAATFGLIAAASLPISASSADTSAAPTLAATGQGIIIIVQTVVVTDSGVDIYYNLRRIGSVSPVPLVPSEIAVSDGEVTGVRHIGAFMGTSVGVISVETGQVGGLTLDIGAMAERPLVGDAAVIEGEWQLTVS
jgi:hypothetical protein